MVEMSNTQKEAVITFIKKRGKNRCFIENWSLISLLNLDAIIMSRNKRCITKKNLISSIAIKLVMLKTDV